MPIATLRSRIREALLYKPERAPLVAMLEEIRKEFDSVDGTGTATIIPPYVGDGLADLIERERLARCLEIGMATGSSAAYMLSAVSKLPSEGRVTSIDRAQTTHYRSIGLTAVAKTKLGHLHRLIENDSIVALFELWRAGEQFDLVYMDGWKTFDHLAAELYFVVRLLAKNGVIVFDDHHMPSVQRAAAMVRGHYRMVEVDVVPKGARPQLAALALQDASHLRIAQARSTLRASTYALRKTEAIDGLPLSSDWNFYSPF